METLPRAFFTYFFQLEYSQRVFLGTWAISKEKHFHFDIDLKPVKVKEIILKKFFFQFFKKWYLGQIPWMGTLPTAFSW
jgi:hypothetical protein